MASYKVVLVDATEVMITADDLDLYCGASGEREDGEKCQKHWFNFTKDNIFADRTGRLGHRTVAAIPYEQVRYIRS